MAEKAVMIRQDSSTEMILQQKASVSNKLDRLYIAVMRQTSVELQEVLTDIGEDPRYLDVEFGQGHVPHTALFMAASQFNDDATEKVRLLLRYHATVDKRDDDGKTALHAACDNGSADVALILMEHGADCTLRDSLEYQPMFYALRRDREVVDTADGGCEYASLEEVVIPNGLALVEALFRNGARVDAKQGRRQISVMEQACRGVNWPVVKLLLHSREFEVNTADEKGMTPLLYAADTIRNDNFEWDDTEDAAGYPQVEYDIRDKHESVIRALIELGADLFAHDHRGRTALSLVDRGMGENSRLSSVILSLQHQLKAQALLQGHSGAQRQQSVDDVGEVDFAALTEVSVVDRILRLAAAGRTGP
jgi:hypothetical protein